MTGALILAALLAQAAVSPPSQSIPQSDEEQATSALVKAAQAAQKAAEAADRSAEAADRSAEAAEKAVEKLSAAQAGAAPATAGAPPASAAAGAAAPSSIAAAPVATGPVWTGTVGAGLIALTGNAQTLSFAANGNFQRKTADWIYAVKASAAYGQNTAPGATANQVTALNALLEARGDRRLNDQLSVYLLAGIDTDHLASIEERPYGESGVSLIWFDERVGTLDKASFSTDLGFRYGHEYRFQYYPTPERLAGVDIVAPHAGVAFHYALNKDVTFNDDFGVLANVVGQTRLLLTNTAKLASRLTERVGLAVTFLVNDDSAPPPGKVQTDTALTVGLEVAF